MVKCIQVVHSPEFWLIPNQNNHTFNYFEVLCFPIINTTLKWRYLQVAMRFSSSVFSNLLRGEMV